MQELASQGVGAHITSHYVLSARAERDISQHMRFCYLSHRRPLGRLKQNFMWSLLGTGERTFVQMVQVTWPRWPPYPYMVKTLNTLLLRNGKAGDLETWFAASDAWVLPSLFKWWHLMVSYGKKVKQWIFRNCCSLWYQSWQYQLTKWVPEYYQVYSNDDPGVTLTYFTARSALVPYAFVWEKGKTVDFSETIVVYDKCIKVGRCIQLNVYMNHYEYQSSRSFIDLCRRPLKFNIFKLLFLKTARPIEAILHMELSWDGRMKVRTNGLCHMTKMAAMPIYGKKSSSLESKSWWPWMLVCSIGCSGTTKFVSIDDQGLTLTYFTARSNLVPYAFVSGIKG